MKSTSAVLLASGGLDSSTLAYWLRAKNVTFIPVFINYGQHCARTELETLRHVLPSDRFGEAVCLDVSSIYAGASSRLIAAADLWKDEIVGEDLYLPYRNLLILSIGAAFAQARGIASVYSAFINSNHAREIDASAAFLDRLGEMLADYGSVKVEMPFRNLSKLEVAKIGLEVGAPIAETFSCQASPAIPCGACPNCVDRLDALAALG